MVSQVTLDPSVELLTLEPIALVCPVWRGKDQVSGFGELNWIDSGFFYHWFVMFAVEHPLCHPGRNH